MEFSAAQIAALLGGTVEGDENVAVSNLSKIEEGVPGTLSFLANPKYTNYIYDTNASIVIVNKTLSLEKPIKSTCTLIRVEDSYASFATLLEMYNQFKGNKVGIEQPSFISENAKVGTDCYVGAFAYIGQNVKIGNNTKIYPHVYIGHSCHIGNHCEISSHASIGCDGFGFFSDRQGQHHKIPQIGNVVIEDNCEIGSQCAVDRATLTETRIKKGTKIDNLCHISHNVEIGENGLITAGFIVAGSTKIGKNLTTAGGVHITGHIQVADRVTLSGRAGVTNDITEPGVYGGFPLENHKDSIRTLISIPQIKILRKQVKQILKHLNLNVDE